MSKRHRPAIHSTPHGTIIRSCADCHQTWLLHRDDKGQKWVPISESYEDGSVRAHDRHEDLLVCGGDLPTTGTKQATGNTPSSTTRFCFCGPCKTANQKQHFPDDENCYCPNCRGKKRHSVVRG